MWSAPELRILYLGGSALDPGVLLVVLLHCAIFAIVHIHEDVKPPLPSSIF